MKRLRFATVAALTLLVTCDRAHDISGPSAAISDGNHLAGNRNFFFLPPLVPNPVGTPGYEPLAFDATARPTVTICRLLGDACATTQPAGFPLIYTMASGPGGETVRLAAADQQFIVNWHAKDFSLDPASYYRITVLLGNAPLGYADVDVVSDGRELRNVNTNEYIGLVDGRTLPIKFRIERGAVAFVNVAEQIAVGDAIRLLPPVAVGIHEGIVVSDASRMLPPVAVDISEGIAVSDATRMLPAAIVQIDEHITIADLPSLLLPIAVTIDEQLTVSDLDRVLPPAQISVAELVAISDQIRALPPIDLSLGEQIAVGDGVRTLPPVNLEITETIAVTDAVALTPSSGSQEE